MNHPTRIAFLSEHASPVSALGGEDSGGQNVYVAEVSRNLGRLGYAVDVFTRSGRPETPVIINWAPNVRVINLQVGPPRFLLKDQLWPLMPAFRDVLMHFAADEGIVYNIIHSNFWMSGWVAAELKRALSLPVVHIFHAMGMTKRRHQGDADTSPDERIRIERHIIREVDRLIAQCPSERAELVGDYETAPEKVAVIPSAVNIKRFRPVPQAEARQRLNLDPDERLIVYVGRLVPRKDVGNIVRALARLLQQPPFAGPNGQPVRLLVVGGNSADPDPELTLEIGTLQKLADELNLSDRVIFAGNQQPDVLRYYYSAGDVAVTTPWYEPFGLTPLEAMACGRPVIGSAVGGITFTIKDGETGFLVPPQDPVALAGRLHQLLTDAPLREQLGRAARSRVEQEFTWERVARRTAALYEELLAATTYPNSLEVPVPAPDPLSVDSPGGYRGSG